MKKILLICAMALASSYSFASYSDAEAPASKKFDTKACKKRCMEELNDAAKCEFICDRDKK